MSVVATVAPSVAVLPTAGGASAVASATGDVDDADVPDAGRLGAVAAGRAGGTLADHPAGGTPTVGALHGRGRARRHAIEPCGAATIASGRGTVVARRTCDPGGAEQPSIDALPGALADVVGPLVDAVDAGAGPATGRLGSARALGVGCGAGPVEAT